MITKVFISADSEGLVIEFDNGDDGVFELEPGAMELIELDQFDGDGWTVLVDPRGLQSHQIYALENLI